MSVQELVEKMEDMDMFVFANGAPSEALLEDAIKAEADIREEFGERIDQEYAAWKERLKQKQEDVA